MRHQFPCRAVPGYFKTDLLHYRKQWYDFCPSVSRSSQSHHSRTGDFTCSLNGDTNTIPERSITLILEGPKAFFTLYPQPNIPASFFSSLPTSLYGAVLGKQSDCTGSNFGFFPLPLSLMTMLYGYISSYAHRLAMHV